MGLKSIFLSLLGEEGSSDAVENLWLQPDCNKIDQQIADHLSHMDVASLGQICSVIADDLSDFAERIEFLSSGRCNLWEIAVLSIFPLLKPVVHSTFYSSESIIDGRTAFDLYFSLSRFQDAVFSHIAEFVS